MRVASERLSGRRRGRSRETIAEKGGQPQVGPALVWCLTPLSNLASCVNERAGHAAARPGLRLPPQERASVRRRGERTMGMTCTANVKGGGIQLPFGVELAGRAKQRLPTPERSHSPVRGVG